MLKKTYTLSNGLAIPALGLGTWLLDDAQAAAAVEAALGAGYRHIDTAQVYDNEAGIGRGIRAVDVAREEVFVTTKVAAEHKSYDSAAKSIDESLKKLGIDHIDLAIIHSPQPWAEVNQSENRWFEGNRETWRALEDAYNAGKVRAIGVSNFEISDIENIMGSCRIKPMVNQILAHVGHMPFELSDWCAENGILMETYSPIAHGAALNSPEISRIAERYDASAAQICIRYVLQLGMVALPKTANPAHIAANAKVDFEISAEDMAKLGTLSISDYGEANAFPVFGGKL